MITVAECLKWGLSKNAAILFYEIVILYSKAKKNWGGYLWLDITRKQLQMATGLTDWQVRSALAELKKRKLIVVEQHKNSAGMAVSFIRPLVTKLPPHDPTQKASKSAPKPVPHVVHDGGNSLGQVGGKHPADDGGAPWQTTESGPAKSGAIHPPQPDGNHLPQAGAKSVQSIAPASQAHESSAQSPPNRPPTVVQSLDNEQWVKAFKRLHEKLTKLV